MRRNLPAGTVTFLFTDVEGSTRLLDALGADGFAEALADHRRVVRQACARNGGVEVDTQGDASAPTTLSEMTDSAHSRGGKRERLVESARAALHEQGAQKTTIAEVAEPAHVPAGNVYYYFKTKDELVGAVLDSYAAEAARLIETSVDWAEGQFRQLGRPDARDLALALLSGIQGAALLANTFRDPEILRGETRHLEGWIDSLT